VLHFVAFSVHVLEDLFVETPNQQFASRLPATCKQNAFFQALQILSNNCYCKIVRGGKYRQCVCRETFINVLLFPAIFIGKQNNWSKDGFQSSYCARRCSENNFISVQCERYSNNIFSRSVGLVLSNHCQMPQSFKCFIWSLVRQNNRTAKHCSSPWRKEMLFLRISAAHKKSVWRVQRTRQLMQKDWIFETVCKGKARLRFSTSTVHHCCRMNVSYNSLTSAFGPNEAISNSTPNHRTQQWYYLQNSVTSFKIKSVARLTLRIRFAWRLTFRTFIVVLFN